MSYGNDHDHDHRELTAEVRGLREDLSRAEERIREMELREEAHDEDIRRLWAHISNMPGGV